MENKIRNRYSKLVLLALIALFSVSNLAAQSASINTKGSVTDAQGEPIIGATIKVLGASTGTVTDVDGNFDLRVSANGVLEVSYIGYKTKTISVNNQTTINVKLEENAEVLGEVLVIGYGSVKKEDATGSVVAIKAEEMNRGLVTNAQDLMLGRIAGVSVITGGGAPGTGSKIRIRGGSSLAAVNDPLLVIDGVIMSNETVAGMSNGLSSVNPNDIETFTVLKDASATAIYGSRASNGVILITTKKGVAGKPKFSYDGNLAISTRKKTIDVLSGDEYRAYITNNFGSNASMMRALNEYPDVSTDWQDEIYRTAFGTEHNLSAFGTIGASIPYRASIGYLNQNGILNTSKFERFAGSFSLTPTLLEDHLKVNLNAKGAHINNRFADQGAVGGAISFDPTKPVMNGSIYGGFFAWTQGGAPSAPLLGSAGRNPVSLLEMREDESKVKSFIGNAQFDYKFHFLPELRLNMNVGIDYSSSDGDNYTSPWAQQSFATDPLKGGNQSFYTQKDQNKIFEVYGQYTKELSSIHKIDVMGGHSYQSFEKSGTNRDFYVDRNPDTFGELIVKAELPDRKWKATSVLASFFGRVNYNLLDKYLFTVTVRADGSSRFEKSNRWGTFPSTAFAWKMKEESFLKDVNVLSDLKLRLGWGLTGQQDLGTDHYYSYMSFFRNGKGAANFPMYDNNGNVTWVNVLAPTGANSKLKWETTHTYNVGIDYGFLNNRINGAIDLYHRKTTDLLSLEVPAVAGTNFAEYIPANIGSLINKGIEFSINSKPIVTKDFVWDLAYNISYNNSKITQLTYNDNEASVGKRFGSTGGDGAELIQIHSVGYAPGTFFVYEQVYNADGKPIEGLYVDRNNDGVINDRDLYHFQKPAADVLMGINSKFLYKQWDLGFNLRASLGNYVYNSQAANAANLAIEGVFGNAHLSNIQKSALETNFGTRQRLSDYYVQNASFIRVDNINLGYTFENLTSRNIRVRVYGTVQNPFVFTKYKGLDPEMSDGIDRNPYPRPFVGLFGVNVNF